MKANNSKSCWDKIERILLLLTFLCIAVTTFYSIRTATTALKQASNELRPWISVSGVDNYFHVDSLETKFQITNIGRLPAYVMIEANAYKDGNSVKKMSGFEDIPTEPIVLMPNQTTRFRALEIKGETYKAILKGTDVTEFIQSIRVNYGLSKEEIGNFFVYQKIKFDHSKLPLLLKNSKQPAGIWTHEESEFR
jgi:hypothetical protein